MLITKQYITIFSVLVISYFRLNMNGFQNPQLCFISFILNCLCGDHAFFSLAFCLFTMFSETHLELKELFYILHLIYLTKLACSRTQMTVPILFRLICTHAHIFISTANQLCTHALLKMTRHALCV